MKMYWDDERQIHNRVKEATQLNQPVHAVRLDNEQINDMEEVNENISNFVFLYITEM